MARVKPPYLPVAVEGRSRGSFARILELQKPRSSRAVILCCSRRVLQCPLSHRAVIEVTRGCGDPAVSILALSWVVMASDQSAAPLSHSGKFTVWYRVPPSPCRLQNLENKGLESRLWARSLSLRELRAKSREHRGYGGGGYKLAFRFGTGWYWTLILDDPQISRFGSRMFVRD